MINTENIKKVLTFYVEYDTMQVRAKPVSCPKKTAKVFRKREAYIMENLRLYVAVDGVGIAPQMQAKAWGNRHGLITDVKLVPTEAGYALPVIGLQPNIKIGSTSDNVLTENDKMIAFMEVIKPHHRSLAGDGYILKPILISN